MTNTTTKRALLTSSMSLLLCVAMLIGSTFAWFTDSASTGVNSIIAGNLDLELSYSNDMNNNWSVVDENTIVFDEATLWEPGYTQVAYFKVENIGNLAFEYKIGTNVSNETEGINQAGDLFKLSEYLRFGIVNVDAPYADRTSARKAIEDAGEPKTFQTYATGLSTLAAGTSEMFAMVVWMPEDVGNVANHDGSTIPSIKFGIAVNATQAPSESDSFGFEYDDAAIVEGSDANEKIENAIVATSAELQAMLEKLTDTGSGNATINIVSDITLKEGEKWVPATVDGYTGAGVITINGNGHTISGLNDTLISGGFAGNSGIIIKNLTISDANITSSNSQGYGAFINTVDSMPTITLENCHLVNSVITDTMGARVGGLIGWTSGYNNQNDGPVDTKVTVTNCSVKNCTITAAGSVGAIIGHAGSNPATYHTITNCTVENNKLTSNDESYRVGAIVGTANVGEVSITGCTSTNNTFLQNNAGAEIARPNGQYELYGRFVPGTTGKLTIDGVEIN